MPVAIARLLISGRARRPAEHLAAEPLVRRWEWRARFALLDHALNGDLPGGSAADRGCDDEPIGTDRNEAVAGRLRARPTGPGSGSGGPGALLSRAHGAESGRTHRIGIDQPQEVLSLVGFWRVLWPGSTRLTRLPAKLAVRRSASSGAWAKGVAFFFVERRILGEKFIPSSSSATRGAGTTLSMMRSNCTPASGR